MNVIFEVLTFSEACTMWGKGNSLLRNLVNTNKLVENVDYRKSNGVWLITVEAMTRLYGEPTEGDLFDESY